MLKDTIMYYLTDSILGPICILVGVIYVIISLLTLLDLSEAVKKRKSKSLGFPDSLIAVRTATLTFGAICIFLAALFWPVTLILFLIYHVFQNVMSYLKYPDINHHR